MKKNQNIIIQSLVNRVVEYQNKYSGTAQMQSPGSENHSNFVYGKSAKK